MQDHTAGEFSVSDLYAALNDQRMVRGLSWTQVAQEIWDMSRELNDRRHDHPISPATLSGMQRRGATSCQHALFVLHWLGRSPESFVKGQSNVLDTPLPEVGSDRRLRWNLKRLYEAMNAQRLGRELTWQALSETLRCTPSQLTGLRTARFATNMALAMRIVAWLNRPATDFVYAATW